MISDSMSLSGSSNYIYFFDFVNYGFSVDGLLIFIVGISFVFSYLKFWFCLFDGSSFIFSS